MKKFTRKFWLALLISLASVFTLLAGVGQQEAAAAPPGQYREAYNCGERWSPFSNINSPHSNDRLYFKQKKSGLTFWLGRGGISCLVPVTDIWVQRGCYVKQWIWDSIDQAWYLRRTFKKPGWNTRRWEDVAGRAFKEKWRVYCKGS